VKTKKRLRRKPLLSLSAKERLGAVFISILPLWSAIQIFNAAVFGRYSSRNGVWIYWSEEPIRFTFHVALHALFLTTVVGFSVYFYKRRKSKLLSGAVVATVEKPNSHESTFHKNVAD
jgi:hypothetical protein